MARETDLDALKSALADRAEELCLDLFGQPTRKVRHEWRWGREGSLVLRLRGKGSPSIFDHTEWRGGNMLDAIMLALDHHRVADSIAWAKEWMGLAATDRRKVDRAAMTRPTRGRSPVSAQTARNPSDCRAKPRRSLRGRRSSPH